MSNWKHGHASAGYPSSTYISWQRMWERCTKPNCKDYPRYGGRGITVDPMWKNFANFLADMGERPDGLQLDRIDTNGNYCKANCRWATPTDQARNRRPDRKLKRDYFGCQ